MAVTDATGLGLSVILSWWLMFFASMLIMSVAGATNMFGIYSPNIKSTFGYDQTMVNLVNHFKDVGSNIGVLSNIASKLTPLWAVLVFGMLMNFYGYILI